MEAAIDYKKLGEQIKRLRIERGLTQEALAERIGCNTSHISNIENNYTKLSLNVLFAISNVLNVSIDYLLSPQMAIRDTVLNLEIEKKLNSCTADQKEKLLKIIDILISTH